MEGKDQISKVTKISIPGQREREVKKANEELEFRPDSSAESTSKREIRKNCQSER